MAGEAGCDLLATDPIMRRHKSESAPVSTWNKDIDTDGIGMEP